MYVNKIFQNFTKNVKILENAGVTVYIHAYLKFFYVYLHICYFQPSLTNEWNNPINKWFMIHMDRFLSQNVSFIRLMG